ncbi:MAG: hypothetical protein ACI814_000917, partial [Mariniblastus sp.]
MLAGHTPFKSTEAIEFAEMHRVERPRPLTLIRAGIREAICSIVMKALEKEPALRYQNASEMLVDVGGGMNDQPSAHGRKSCGRSGISLARRTQRRVAGAVYSFEQLNFVVGVGFNTAQAPSCDSPFEKKAETCWNAGKLR